MPQLQPGLTEFLELRCIWKQEPENVTDAQQPRFVNPLNPVPPGQRPMTQVGAPAVLKPITAAAFHARVQAVTDAYAKLGKPPDGLWLSWPEVLWLRDQVKP